MKITKKIYHDFLKHKLSTDKVWACTALLRIYDFQTDTEKDSETTHVINNVGFTGADAELLSSFAKQYKSRQFLTKNQLDILFKKIPKYHNQIFQISDRAALEKLTIRWITDRDGLFAKT